MKRINNLQQYKDDAFNWMGGGKEGKTIDDAIDLIVDTYFIKDGNGDIPQTFADLKNSSIWQSSLEKVAWNYAHAIIKGDDPYLVLFYNEMVKKQKNPKYTADQATAAVIDESLQLKTEVEKYILDHNMITKSALTKFQDDAMTKISNLNGQNPLYFFRDEYAHIHDEIPPTRNADGTVTENNYKLVDTTKGVDGDINNGGKVTWSEDELNKDNVGYEVIKGLDSIGAGAKEVAKDTIKGVVDIVHDTASDVVGDFFGVDLGSVKTLLLFGIIAFGLYEINNLRK